MKWQTVFVVASVAVLMMAFRAYGAPVRVPGVNVGDWASYVVTYAGNSTMGPSDMENMTVATFTVLDILGANVTMQGHGYYLNGSETIETGWIDVDTGATGGNATGSGTLIAANLVQGDLVYTNTSGPFMDGRINETISRSYLGSLATVNHYSMNMTTPSNPFYGINVSMDWYWYQATGIPAEISVSYAEEIGPLPLIANYSVQQTGTNMTWYDWHMTVSNIIPEFPTLNVAPVFMIAALMAVVVYKMRIRNRQEMRG